MKLAASVLLAALSAHSASALDDGLIVGGSPTAPADYPWMVSIGYPANNAANYVHSCGGSLIAKNVVLTAAHCTDTGSEKDYIVRIKGDATTRYDQTDKMYVKQIINHPKYSSSTQDNDISLLILTEDSEVDPVKYDIANLVGTNPITRAVGWGNTAYGGQHSENLLDVELPVITNKVCRGAYSQAAITDNMVCAGYPRGGRDSCTRDSGGPLVATQEDGIRTVVGVVSWGRGCASPRYYGVYARVQQYTQFIQDALDTANNAPLAMRNIQEMGPTLGAQRTCGCQNGNGKYQTCDNWYTESRTTTTACLMDYFGGEQYQPTCTVPANMEVRFSRAHQRWVLEGCTPGPERTSPVAVEDTDLALDAQVPSTTEPSSTSVIPLVAGCSAFSGLVAALAMFVVMRKKANNTIGAEEDKFESFQVEASTSV